MMKLNNKILSILVNFLLVIWQLPQIIVGIIGLAVFRDFEIYTNEFNHITVINVNKGNLFGTACFSSGPIIFTVPNCSEITKRHETGHSKQSIYMGPLFFTIALASIPRFWIRRWFNKSHEWYLSGWPEGGSKFGAEELGGTKELK